MNLTISIRYLFENQSSANFDSELFTFHKFVSVSGDSNGPLLIMPTAQLSFSPKPPRSFELSLPLSRK